MFAHVQSAAKDLCRARDWWFQRWLRLILKSKVLSVTNLTAYVHTPLRRSDRLTDWPTDTEREREKETERETERQIETDTQTHLQWYRERAHSYVRWVEGESERGRYTSGKRFKNTYCALSSLQSVAVYCSLQCVAACATKCWIACWYTSSKRLKITHYWPTFACNVRTFCTPKTLHHTEVN